MITINGTGVAPGKASGKILYFCSRNDDFSKETTDFPEDEVDILRFAMMDLCDDMRKDIEFYRANNRIEEADLAESRILLLEDMISSGNCEALILDNHYSARRAVHETTTSFRILFENMEDEFMRDRSGDIKFMSEQLLERIGGDKQPFPHLLEPSVVVAEELIPEGTLCFEKDKILALIIKDSTYNSHSAILARLWGIPSIAGISPNADWNNRQCQVDGEAGTITIY